MSCVAKITDCDTSIFYTGMPAFLNAILSCHSCKKTGSDDQFVSILQNSTLSVDLLFVGYYIEATATKYSNVINCLSATTLVGKTIANCLVYSITGPVAATTTDVAF